MLKFIVLSILLLAQCSCQKKPSVLTQEWRGAGPAPLIPSGLALTDSRWNSQNLSVEFSQQKWNGILVEDSFVKKISDSEGPRFISMRLIDEFGLRLSAQVLYMRSREAAAQVALKDYAQTNKRGHWLQSPQLILRSLPQIEPVWRGIFEDSEGTITAIDIDKNLKLLSEKRMGSHLGEVSATVYPLGPLRSSLKTVTLDGLYGNANLNSPQIHVFSSSNQEALAENELFLYPVEDLRFHQVQVYFYVSQSFAWFLQNFKFKLPFRVEVETSFGYPEKTNTAFYYNKKIRLGEGDDHSFTHLALDPSVVTHESVHAVEDVVARLPYEGQGGSLNEAFADYFTAAQFNNPNLGEASYKKSAFKRTIKNNFKLADLNGGLYHDSEIVSGLLWNLRTEIGDQKMDQLAWNLLLHLTPRSQLNNFKIEILNLLSQESPQVQSKGYLILKERGWID